MLAAERILASIWENSQLPWLIDRRQSVLAMPRFRGRVNAVSDAGSSA